jgi:pimeloyl-ACP methyl ester carboxylesterase
MIAPGILAWLGTGCMSGLWTDREIAAKLGRTPAPFLETRTVQAGGVTVRYAELGAGDETVVLLHGFPETLQGWRHTAPALAGSPSTPLGALSERSGSKGFRVLVPDLVGAGGSGRPDIGYTPQNMAAFVRDFLDAAGVQRAHVVGTDTGLVVAAAFAGMYPGRTGRLVLAAGTVHPEDITSWEIRMMCRPVLGELAVYNFFTGLVVKTSLLKGFTDKRLVSREMYDECAESLTSSGGRRAALRMIRAFTREAPFMVECLKKIEGPALVIYADRDCYFPVPAGRRLAAELPRAEFRLIPECGHFLQEEKPEEFNRLLLEFLRGGGGGPR